MIMDYNCQFNDGTAAASWNTASTSTDSAVLDMMTANWNAGAGTPVWVIVSLGTSCTSGSTFNVEMRTGSSSTTLTTSHFVGRTFSSAEMIKGAYPVAMPIPTGWNLGRYVKLVYHASGSAFLTGVLDAYLSLNAPRA